MKNQTEMLARAYNMGLFEEYQRLDHPYGRAEFHQVCQIVDRHLEKYSTVIDIGSGPGRYAEHLINKGHFAGCIDIAEKPLQFFEQRLKPNQRANLLFNETACASQLDWIPDQIADMILLMGPMYHLTAKQNREKTIQHCARVLKPQGHLFVMYLNTRSGSAAKKLPSNQKNRMYRNTTNTIFQGFSVRQYRLTPQEAQREASSYFHACEQYGIIENGNHANLPNLQNAAQFLVHYKLNS